MAVLVAGTNPEFDDVYSNATSWFTNHDTGALYVKADETTIAEYPYGAWSRVYFAELVEGSNDAAHAAH